MYIPTARARKLYTARRGGVVWRGAKAIASTSAPAPTTAASAVELAAIEKCAKARMERAERDAQIAAAIATAKASAPTPVVMSDFEKGAAIARAVAGPRSTSAPAPVKPAATPTPSATDDFRKGQEIARRFGGPKAAA